MTRSAGPDSWDPLHSTSEPDIHWDTSNLGEAMPGVLTPLGWTLWGPATERCAREAFFAMGALTRAERPVPVPVRERYIRIFYGRVALQVEFLTSMGDRMPGSSGGEVAKGIFGAVPADIEYHPTSRRYPVVAWRLPVTFMTVPRRLRSLHAATQTWWNTTIPGIAALDLDGAIDCFRSASARFDRAVVMQALVLFDVVQPIYDALTRLTARTGVGDVTALTGGYGGVPEVAVVADLWRAARNELSLDTVVASHGYHGPMEGELSGRVWREDREPLRRLLSDYASRPDSDDPRLRDATRRGERIALERELVEALAPTQRPAAVALLRLAARRLPLRGVAKASFLQALDVARASARRAGECLAQSGVLSDPEDVFYVTVDELLGGLPSDVGELVARRRERRDEYLTMRLPTNWRGVPDPIPVDDIGAAPTDVGSLSGTGVSPGIVEGTVRVVLEPDFVDVEPGEILVAPTTDPSWSSIMFISAALVVDIGGLLSHAAVVARELGIPCVVNTLHGSRSLRTGDYVRVDGAAGTIEILKRAVVVVTDEH